MHTNSLSGQSSSSQQQQLQTHQQISGSTIPTNQSNIDRNIISNNSVMGHSIGTTGTIATGTTNTLTNICNNNNTNLTTNSIGVTIGNNSNNNSININSNNINIANDSNNSNTSNNNSVDTINGGINSGNCGSRTGHCINNGNNGNGSTSDGGINDIPGSSGNSSTNIGNNPTQIGSISTTQNTICANGLAHECAGCGKRITDRYLLKALDLMWHEDCLKCGCCDCRLGEVGSTLYNKANLILCKRDYLRLFGTTGYCAACNKVIPAFEMVMRAKNNVYHLECFACQQCNHRYVAQ